MGTPQRVFLYLSKFPMMSPLLSFVAALQAAIPGAPGVGLDDVLRTIDANYPKLASQRQEIAVARARERERRGVFDPVATAGTEAQRYNSSSYPGKAYDTSVNYGQVEVTDANGVKLYGGYRLNTGNVKSPLSSNGALGEPFLGVLVPLSRGYGVNPRTVALSQARLGIPLAEQAVAQVRLETLRDGATAYVEWTAAAARRRIAREILAVARARANAVRRRFEAGDEREMSVVEANAEVERREGALAKAERDVQKAALKLRLYLWNADGTPADFDLETSAPPLPDAPVLAEPEVEADLRRALETRPEIAAVDLGREVLRLTLELARNDRRPALDLGASVGYDAGSGGIGPTSKIGLYLTVPLRQNAADGRIADAQAKLRKLELDRALLVQSIRTEVADAVSAVRTAYDRVQAARAEVALNRRLERMETLAFELGEGTIFLLNQRERTRAESEGRLIDVLAEYQSALALLRAASAGF